MIDHIEAGSQFQVLWEKVNIFALNDWPLVNLLGDNHFLDLDRELQKWI